MSRKTIEAEKLYVVEEKFIKQDEKWIYIDSILSNGHVVHNKHPVNPEEPKEVILARVSALGARCWRDIQRKKQQAV